MHYFINLYNRGLMDSNCRYKLADLLMPFLIMHLFILYVYLIRRIVFGALFGCLLLLFYFNYYY